MEDNNMIEETIIIQQKITIKYNNLDARAEAIGKLLHDTNWSYASEGFILDRPEKWSLSKSEISIPFQNK